MERLLVCKLSATGCTAEAVLNGVPIAAAGPALGPVVVPVHEYTRTGTNTLTLVVGGGTSATARVLAAGCHAEARLLLPRIGHAVDEHHVRTLASVEWQAGPDSASGAASDSASDAVSDAVLELAPELPLSRSVEAELPVSFPRWRWLDAPVNPPVTTALRLQLLAWLQQLARDLARGDPATFLAATRLRTEELALAYQRDADADSARLRQHLLSLWEGGRLNWNALDSTSFQLRPVAGGRLLECGAGDGSPALATAIPTDKPAEGSLAFPLRLALVEGKPYVLR